MKNVTFASLLLLLAMTACSQKPVLEQIDVHKAAALIQANNGLQIVDLRTPGEIAASGTIAGAQVMDFTASDFTKRIATLSKKQPVLLYCAAGGRSSSAAQILHQQQFLTVYDMTPGMNGWLAAGKKPWHQNRVKHSNPVHMTTLFANWHFMRFVRTFMAFWIGFEAWRSGENILYLFAGIFALQAIFNTGCCGNAGCAAPVKRNTTGSDEVFAEEIK